MGPTGVGLGAGKAVWATGTLVGVAVATPAGLVGTTAGAGRVASGISVGVGFDTKGRSGGLAVAVGSTELVATVGTWTVGTRVKTAVAVGFADALRFTAAIPTKPRQ